MVKGLHSFVTSIHYVYMKVLHQIGHTDPFLFGEGGGEVQMCHFGNINWLLLQMLCWEIHKLHPWLTWFRIAGPNHQVQVLVYFSGEESLICILPSIVEESVGWEQTPTLNPPLLYCRGGIYINATLYSGGKAWMPVKTLQTLIYCTVEECFTHILPSTV